MEQNIKSQREFSEAVFENKKVLDGIQDIKEAINEKKITNEQGMEKINQLFVDSYNRVGKIILSNKDNPEVTSIIMGLVSVLNRMIIINRTIKSNSWERQEQELEKLRDSMKESTLTLLSQSDFSRL